MKKYHWPRRVLSLLLCLVMVLGFFPNGIVDRAAAATGYVTDNLVLHLDANNNTGLGFDPNATTWKNLASGGELIKINGQTWGTDTTYGSHYLDFDDNYILLPESVRQTLSGTEFTIEFVLEDFVDGGNINNVMCVTGADSYISQFVANGGTKKPLSSVVNDNFVIFAWGGGSHSFRTCYGTNPWNTINTYASVGLNALNKKTNSLTFSSTAGSKWYQDGVNKSTGANQAPGKTITLDGYLEDGVWQTDNKPQIAFGAASDMIASRFFDANVRAIRIYSDTLSTAEMQQNAAMDAQKYYTQQLDPTDGYVTDNLVLYLDANYNVGAEHNSTAAGWRNLAAGGELVDVSDHSWGTDSVFGTHYLDMNGYIKLPESVRQTIATGAFTIEFLMDDYVGDPANGSGKIANIMALTGSDRWIAATTTPVTTPPNDNFVIYQHSGEGWARFKTNSAPDHNNRAMVSGGINGKTQTIAHNSGTVTWYQDAVSTVSKTGYSATPNVATFTGAQTGEVPQVIFGAATDTVANRAFSGKVRAIRVYSDILTADEIAQNARQDELRHYGPLGYEEDYETGRLVLHLDANNNTGYGFDPNATGWKNLAGSGEIIKVNGQTWGTDELHNSHYLTFTDDYILLPDSVRKALSGTEFTVEFVLDNFKKGSSSIDNIMCVTGADSYIAQFKANGGSKNPGAVVNDNFVIWSNVGGDHNFRTYYGNGTWSAINAYATVGNSSINKVTNTLQFSSSAGNKWYQDGTLIHSGKNYTNKTITLDGYLENGTWQTANKPQIAFGAATDVVSGRHFNANVRAIRIYAGSLNEAEIKANAALDEEAYYTVDESNLEALVKGYWFETVTNTADLAGTSLAQLQAYAESKVVSSDVISVTVADAGNGAYTFTYKRVDTGDVIDTHTFYVDADITLDMAQLTADESAALMNDLAPFAGNGTIAVKWDDTAKAVNYKGTRNGSGNPVSHLYFPIYSSTNAYVYEAEISYVSGGSGWSTLSFAADRTLEHLQYAIWGSIGANGTGAELVRFQDPSKHNNTFAVGHVTQPMTEVLKAMGDKWQDTYTKDNTTYTVTDTVTYKVVVYEDTMYAFIDGVQVVSAPITGVLYKDAKGVFGFNTANTSFNIHKLSVRPITEENEEEELDGIELRFNPVKSFVTDLYEPDTDINTAPIVMQTATEFVSDVSGLEKRPSSIIFDLKLEQGVLNAYSGDKLLGTFDALYKANQPKANVGVRIALGDTATADALVEWAKPVRAGNLWVITNDVELLERMTAQIDTIRGVVDFTGDVVRGPSEVEYVFDTNGDGTIKQNSVVTNAELGKVNVTGGEYANRVAPQFTYKNYTGGYDARQWSEIYDILFTCGYRTVLLPESAIDKESVYQMQGSLVTIFVETDATTEQEFYDLIVSGVNGILSTEYETNISVLESDTFDVDGQNILVRGGHIVGHRGDMGFATTSKDSLPENSVEALISAAQSGVSSVEFDVYMTLDGYLVLNHNTSIKGFFVYEDDCPLTPEQRISDDVLIVNRYWKGDLEYMVSTYNKNIRMQQLYQLYEALDDEYPELRLHHEAKDTRVETLNRIVDLMTDYGLRDRSDIMSTNLSAMQYTNSMGISSQYLSTPSSKNTPNRINAAETVYRPINSTWHTQWGNIDTDYLEELKHYGQTAYPWATYASTYAAYYVQGYQGFTTDAPHHTDDIIRLLTPAYDQETGEVSVIARTLAYHETVAPSEETKSGEPPIRLPAYLQNWWGTEGHSHYVSNQPNEYALEGFEVLVLDGAENVTVNGNKVTVNSNAAGDATLVVRYKQNLDSKSSFYIYSNTFTVGAGTITGFDVTANASVAYDGNAHASATVTEGQPADATITFNWTEGGEDKTSTTVPSFTDVGVYDVGYTISKPNYTDVMGRYRFEITSASASALNVVAKGVEKVYDGAASAVSVTAIDGAKVEYSTDNQTWSTTAPSFTDVVDTTVYYRVSKANYDTATGSVKVKITEAEITGFEVKAADTAKYDGTEKTSATVTDGKPADAKITFTCGSDTFNEVPKFTEVGTYEVSYIIEKDNYKSVTGTYTFKIEEGDITGFSVTANAAATYDGTEKASATVTVGTPADATITYKVGNDTFNAVPKFTEVGTYEVSYTISKAGYNDVTGSYTFTINNAAASALNVVAKGVEKVYDGAASAVSVTAIDGAKVEYSTDNQTWSTTAPAYTDVVDTTVYYRVSKANYDTATGSVKAKITEAEITGFEVKAADTAKYDGTEKTSATVTVGTPADAKITYKVGNDTFNAVPKFTEVGTYEVSYTIEKANYKSVTGTYTFKIKKGDITGFEVKAADTAKFDGTEKASATVTIGTPADAKITYKVGNDTFNAVPKFTEVGTYEVSYTISKDGYNDVTGSYEFTIEKGDITGFEVKAADTAKYDGTEKTSATVTVGTPADAKITYKVGNDTFNAVPKFTEVGTYEVSYTISKDGYNDVTGSYEFTIEEGDIADFEIKANDAVTYDGEAHKSATVVVGVPADAKITYTCNEKNYDDVPAFVDAGTYEVSYTISKPGYNDVTGSYEFTIEKGELELDYELYEKGEVNTPAAKIENLPDGVSFRFGVFKDKASWEAFRATGEGDDDDLIKTFDENEIPVFDEPGTYYLVVLFEDESGNFEYLYDTSAFEVTAPAPETGDTFALGLWLTVAALTAAAGAILVLRRREEA